MTGKAPLRSPTPPPAPPPRPGVQFGKVKEAAGHRIVLFGPGGIGKTTLASMFPVTPIAYVDLDDSLPRLRSSLGDRVESLRVLQVDTWKEFLAALQADGWDGIGAICIDSGTKAEELAIAHTLLTVPHEKGHIVARLEDYGFGKGYSHVFDTFLPLLAALDRHARAGRHVIMVCHDCTSNVPNPAGEDWLRYEPRLQGPPSGKASIRLRVREWADHVLFLGYDVNVKDGKGRGAGTRTLYPRELPHCMAKSRTITEQIPYDQNGEELWKAVLQ